MRQYRTWTYILVGILFISNTSKGQDSTQNKVKIIDDYIKYIDQNNNDYSEINLDGSITSRHKIFIIFGKKKLKGGFAETYLVKDSMLIQARKGTRTFLNNKKTSAINHVEQFYYLNGELCYYKTSKIHEDYLGMNYYDNTNQKDSLISESEIYLSNNLILKEDNKGIEADVIEQLNRIKNSYSEQFERIKYFIEN